MVISPESILDRVVHSPHSWIILDYEGTLVEQASSRSDSSKDHMLENLLTDLIRRPAISVAILSGRQLEELQSLLSIPELWLAGSHGTEWHIPGEEGILHLGDGGEHASIVDSDPVDRGQAISFLWEKQAEDDPLLVYVAKQGNNEEAIRATHDRGGIAMQVGESPGTGNADCHIETYEQVRSWLRKIILKVPPIQL